MLIQCKSDWPSGLPVNTAPNVTKCHPMPPESYQTSPSVTECLTADAVPAGHLVQLPSNLLAVRGRPAVQLLCLPGLLGAACCQALGEAQDTLHPSRPCRLAGLSLLLFRIPRSDIPAGFYIPRCLMQTSHLDSIPLMYALTKATVPLTV